MANKKLEEGINATTRRQSIVEDLEPVKRTESTIFSSTGKDNASFQEMTSGNKYTVTKKLPKSKHLSILVIPEMLNDFKKMLPRKATVNDTINKLIELYIETNGECLNRANRRNEKE